MNASHFVLTSIETGRVVGHALLCPEARYCSVRWLNAARLERRFADAATWRAVLEDLALQDWPKGYIAARSALGKLLIRDDRRGLVAIQFSAGPNFVGDGPTATSALDAYLHSQPLS